MTRPPKKALSGNYKVGYGKPPSQTRFRKSVSGNPGGRPRGMTAGRANRLALQEAHRPIPVPVGNLGPEILVMQSAQNWHRQRATDSLDGTWDRCVLVQR
jgi:hypothetical protein